MSIPQFELEFTRDGMLLDADALRPLLATLPNFSDLLVLSHGWNNDKADAAQLYADLLASIGKVLQLGAVPGLAGRQLGALCVFWPSKRFTDADLLSGGGAAALKDEPLAPLQQALQKLRPNPMRLGDGFTADDPVRNSALDAALRLVPDLAASEQARRKFVLQLRKILDPSAAHPDDGSAEFFTLDAEALFQRFKDAVPVPAAISAGGGHAAALGARSPVAGFSDVFSGFVAAGRRIANFTTYYEMKQRAGTVGCIGLAPVLQRVRAQQAGLRLHLVGHSFGGRLVTAAAHAMPNHTPALSLTLLQAAYSHNGLSAGYDQEKKLNGAFVDVLSQARASGPIVVTHTKNDQAVGLAYPLASRIARDTASALGDRDDPYGGMGRNGAQHLPTEVVVEGKLEKVGAPYDFMPGRVFNLNADDFITDHGAVTGTQVAYAVLSAVAAL